MINLDGAQVQAYRLLAEQGAGSPRSNMSPTFSRLLCSVWCTQLIVMLLSSDCQWSLVSVNARLVLSDTLSPYYMTH